MSQQKALFLEGVNRNFVIGTTEIYKPAPGELLVKLKAASLNPVDWKLQRYEIGFIQFPAILGVDMAGDVVEVGEGAEGFDVGDKVFFQGSFTARNMGFQQYATVPAIRTAKIPTSISYDQAASIPLVLFTAWSGFYNSTQGFGLPVPTASDFNKDQYASTPMVVLGGGSSVGQMAIQLAKLSGFSPIITTASLKNEATLKSLGVTHVIDRHTPLSSLPSEIAKITNNPITLVYDAISNPDTAQAGYDLLAKDGKLVLVSLDSKVNGVEGSGKKVIKAAAYVLAPPENVQLVNDLYKNLTRMLEDGVIVPNRVEALPNGLRGIVDGLRRLEKDQVSAAKLVAHPHETD